MIPTIIPNMGMVWQGLISGTEFQQLKSVNGQAGSQLINDTVVVLEPVSPVRYKTYSTILINTTGCSHL